MCPTAGTAHAQSIPSSWAVRASLGTAGLVLSFQSREEGRLPTQAETEPRIEKEKNKTAPNLYKSHSCCRELCL